MKVRIIKANGVQKKQDYFADILKFDSHPFTVSTSGLEYTSTWGTDTGNNISFNLNSPTSANGHAYIFNSSSS